MRPGFNVDFAPVADVLTNPQNTVIGSRSFGSDPSIDGAMVASEVKGLHTKGMLSTLKHFPGHGDTYEDSHEGKSYVYKTREELENCEWIPFKKGIEAGSDFVMMGHISCPGITGDDTPASLSYTICTEILRDQLGFQGLVITDAMNMGAVANEYASGDAAVRAVQAGADMILMPADFSAAYAGVRNAVQNGTITEERINESVRRILVPRSRCICHTININLCTCIISCRQLDHHFIAARNSNRRRWYLRCSFYRFHFSQCHA